MAVRAGGAGGGAHGHAQSPLLWSPKTSTAFSDGLTRIVRSGADPMQQIKAIKAVADAELKRIAG